jgi:mannosyltransferase OCH1-like enzyme
MIPKKIMQTWKTTQIPDDWKTSPLSIQKFLPHWEYVLMTDEDNIEFVKKYFPNLLFWFISLKFPIQRADVIRYMWLYINGGVYMDLDIEIVADIEELFVNSNVETWLLKAPRNFAGHFTNFFMASAPKNLFWIEVLNECVKPIDAWVILPHHVISQQTGLAALTRAVSKWRKPIVLLPQGPMVPCDYCSHSHCQKPFTYTKFLKGKSWNGVDTYIINLVGCNPEILLLIFIGLFVFFIWKCIIYKNKFNLK